MNKTKHMETHQITSAAKSYLRSTPYRLHFFFPINPWCKCWDYDLRLFKWPNGPWTDEVIAIEWGNHRTAGEGVRRAGGSPQVYGVDGDGPSVDVAHLVGPRAVHWRQAGGGGWSRGSDTLTWRAHGEGGGWGHLHVELRGQFEGPQLLNFLL